MAADGVNVFTSSQPPPGDRPGPVELWHRPCPGLWPDDGGRHASLCVGLLRNDHPRTAPRLVSGCQGQERRQTRPQPASSGGDPVLCPAARLGGGLDGSHLPSTRPRHGRLDAGATLHHALDQGGGSAAVLSPWPGASSKPRGPAPGAPIGQPSLATYQAVCPLTGP
jgi:hypothetical protein